MVRCVQHRVKVGAMGDALPLDAFANCLLVNGELFDGSALCEGDLLHDSDESWYFDGAHFHVFDGVCLPEQAYSQFCKHGDLYFEGTYAQYVYLPSSAQVTVNGKPMINDGTLSIGVVELGGDDVVVVDGLRHVTLC